MRSELRIALVGCSGMGVAYCRQVERIPGTRIVAVVDSDPGKRLQAAEALDAAAYPDLATMLERETEGLDGAVCANLPSAHAETCIALLKARVSVFCEKPMALTFADCRRMVEAQGDPLPFLQASFRVRTCRAFQPIVEILQSGRLGNIRNIHFFQSPGSIYATEAWHLRKETVGGLFLERICHPLDIFRMVFRDEPLEVYALHADNVLPQYTIPDNMYATYRFPGGRAAHITYLVGRAIDAESHDSREYIAKGHWLEYIIIGTKGSLAYPLWQMQIIVNELINGQVAPAERIRLPGDDAEAPYHDIFPQMQVFIECIRTGRRPPQDAEDALKTMRAVFASEKSVDEGRIVKISEIE